MSRKTSRVPPREIIEAALNLTVARKGRKDGLQFKNLKYHSEHLLEVRMLPKAERPDELIIRIDRENLEVIHFLHPLTGEWHPAYLRDDLVPRVRGRSLDEYEFACALRRSREAEFAETDPDFKETYAELDRAQAVQAADPKLSERTKAEAARERQLDRARRQTKPPAKEGPADGEDLSSQVDRTKPHFAAATDGAVHYGCRALR